MWRFTRIGWVTAAVSQNERGAAALGISPGFVSSATWMAGAALAAVAGILFSPITQVSIGGMSLLVIPVLAAVLLGGFDSFPATLASGLLVAISQTIALNYNDFFEKHLHITWHRTPSAADCGGGDAGSWVVAAPARPHVGASAGDRHWPHPLGGGPSGCCDHLGSHPRGAWEHRPRHARRDVHDRDAVVVAGGADGLCGPGIAGPVHDRGHRWPDRRATRGTRASGFCPRWSPARSERRSSDFCSRSPRCARVASTWQ